MECPEGMRGRVLQVVDGETALEEVGRFDHLTYWLHDAAPSGTDRLAKSLAWLELARVLHAPVDPAEVDREVLAAGASRAAPQDAPVAVGEA